MTKQKEKQAADLDTEAPDSDPGEVLSDPIDDEAEPLGRSLDPDSILDALVPPSIDWRGTVRRHPLVSVAAIGLVGYLVGRTKGAAIMAGVTAGLSGALMRQLGDVFEGDFFDLD